MDVVQAYNMIKGICDNVRVTKQERDTIDSALAIILDKIQERKVKNIKDGEDK